MINMSDGLFGRRFGQQTVGYIVQPMVGDRTAVLGRSSLWVFVMDECVAVWHAPKLIRYGVFVVDKCVAV